MNFLTEIPALYRKRVYLAFFLLGVVFGAIQLAYVSIDGAAVPTWVKVALVVYAYVGTALGLTAASNVTSEDGPPPSPEDAEEVH